jgi:hypothetical protein
MEENSNESLKNESLKNPAIVIQSTKFCSLDFRTAIGYEPIVTAMQAAMDRMSIGKGRQRHARHSNQPVEQQDIALFSHGWRVDQIRKKANELERLKRSARADEVLDIICYACVEWLKLTGNIPE